MALSFQNQGSALARRVLLVVFLVVSLAAMTVYAREGSDGVLHRAQAAVAGAVAPLRAAGAAADAAVDGAVDAAADAGADEGTLSALREQNEQLRQALAQGEEYRLEAQRLQELLNLKDAYKLEGTAARVIGRSTDAWNQTVTIDAGSDAGVETGMTVMGPTGVAGQVVATAPGSSTVRLLSDPASGAAALIQSSRAEGIVRGSLDGLLYLENIGADVTVSVGDVVLTSGLGGSYVRGLLIGTVARVDGAAGDATRRIVVAPGESIRALEEVFVVSKADSPAAGDGGSPSTGSSGSQGGAAS